MADSKDDLGRKLVTVWCVQPTSLPANERLTEIASLLYAYRNDRLTPEEIRRLPKDAVSEDGEAMAAVEHYFYARSQVANAEYSAQNMKVFTNVYQWAKRAGLDLRHDKDKPTTQPSHLQKTWAMLGADQGKQDLEAWNLRRKKFGSKALSPPTLRLPPNFAGKYGKSRTDKVQY
jgi:hypothetical protein